MFENLINQMGAQLLAALPPLALSGLRFYKKPEEVAKALKAKRAAIAQSIERRKAIIQDLIDREDTSKRATVDTVIAAAQKHRYFGATLTETAQKALTEARAILDERLVLETFALVDDHFDPAAFTDDTIGLSYLDVKFLFTLYEPAVAATGGIEAIMPAMGLATVAERAGGHALPSKALSLSDLDNGPEA